MVLQFLVRDGLKRHNALNQSQDRKKYIISTKRQLEVVQKIHKRNPEIKKIAWMNLNTRPELWGTPIKRIQAIIAIE